MTKTASGGRKQLFRCKNVRKVTADLPQRYCRRGSLNKLRAGGGGCAALVAKILSYGARCACAREEAEARTRRCGRECDVKQKDVSSLGNRKVKNRIAEKNRRRKKSDVVKTELLSLADSDEHGEQVAVPEGANRSPLCPKSNHVGSRRIDCTECQSSGKRTLSRAAAAPARW
eukprot:2173453-Pleurochrysis_carterae.AAC.4